MQDGALGTMVSGQRNAYVNTMIRKELGEPEKFAKISLIMAEGGGIGPRSSEGTPAHKAGSSAN
jgi:hypothetical protein